MVAGPREHRKLRPNFFEIQAGVPSEISEVLACVT